MNLTDEVVNVVFQNPKNISTHPRDSIGISRVKVITYKLVEFRLFETYKLVEFRLFETYKLVEFRLFETITSFHNIVPQIIVIADRVVISFGPNTK